jgi:hypothetical protein
MEDSDFGVFGSGSGDKKMHSYCRLIFYAYVAENGSGGNCRAGLGPIIGFFGKPCADTTCEESSFHWSALKFIEKWETFNYGNDRQEPSRKGIPV